MANINLIESALALQNRLIDRFAPLDDSFIEPSTLPWIETVEAETDSILAELTQLLSLDTGLPSMASLSDRQYGLGGTSWQSFVFRMFGNKVHTASVLCPKTFDLVNNIAEVDTAMFSVLQPGATIEEHHGPSKAELRYHLPLVVPTSEHEICGLRVGTTIQGWQVGKGVVFDDTVDHEAWNLSDGVRVVLFIGCRRPMPTPLAQIIDRLTRLATKGHPDVMEILEKAELDNRRVVGRLMQRDSGQTEPGQLEPGQMVADLREPAARPFAAPPRSRQSS